MSRSVTSRSAGTPAEGLAPQACSVAPEDIMEAVKSIMSSIDGDLSTVNLKLYAEIESLSNFIDAAKAEIAALRPDEITERHLPSATDELAAIVGSTEQATNTIFESVEAIESQTANMDPEMAEIVTNAVTAVYEACSFQDITGQRISKVVGALKHIEAKVESMLTLLGGKEAAYVRVTKAVEAEVEQDPEAKLLNGPQLGGPATSQDEIDALFG